MNMGVMSCSRNECENVMCTRYSTEHGYICNECFDELCAKGDIFNVANFMKSVKPTRETRKASRAYYETLFKRIDDSQ